MNAVALPATRSSYEVFCDRAAALKRLRADPAKLASLLVYYRDHPADMINDWGVTIDPRVPVGGREAAMPFTLDPRQREWLDWTHENFLKQQYGGTEKSRDVGLSWLLVAYSITLCLTWPGIAIGWGSFSQIKVDKAGEMGSLFEKGREYLRWLPPEFCAGYNENDPKCCKEMLLKFPGTGSSIFGEIGDKIGRGNRATLYFIDEAAYLEHGEGVDGNLAKATNCRQDVSTVRGMANSFAARMHDGISRKFTFHWRSNPRFSQADYDKFLAQWGPVITAQELDISYTASVEGIIIPQEWVQAAVDAHKKLGIEPSGERRGALDIADLGRDLNAFAARHGILILECVSWAGTKDRDISHTAERAYDLCDVLRLEGFDYDADGGYGAGVRSEANRIDERRAQTRQPKRRVKAWRGSGAVFNPESNVRGTDVKAKDRFQNAKAQAWHSLAARFHNTWRAVGGATDYDRDNLISLSKDIKELAKLCIELSQPQWKYSATGKLMVDKVPDGAQSPNLADALMMLMAPKQRPMRISDNVLDVIQGSPAMQG